MRQVSGFQVPPNGMVRKGPAPKARKSKENPGTARKSKDKQSKAAIRLEASSRMAPNFVHACVRVCMHVQMQLCKCACMHVFKCAQVCLLACVHARMHACMYNETCAIVCK